MPMSVVVKEFLVVWYILRRVLLMIPTILGILGINFIIVQFAPGGPVEKIIAEITFGHSETTGRFTGGGGGGEDLSNLPNAGSIGGQSSYIGSYGVDPEFLQALEKQFGFDKPAHERFLKMVWDYARFDLGESYYRSISVWELIKEKLPVSVSLGLWTVFISYLVSIPLGIRKAIKDGSPFDIWSSVVIVISYAIPSFLFAILLLVLFAGGSYWQIFPLRGLVSDNWQDFSLLHKVFDYFWHITLPVIAMSISGFATLTLLTKNSILEEMKKQYVCTARARGLCESRVFYGHIFRNAMLVVISGFPAAFISIFLTGSLIVETLFSLDGLGLLGFESIINRDYPVVFGTLYVFSLIGLVVNLISDLVYVWIDPRISFRKQEA
jgi:microcin C transport system permease protein